VSVTFDAPTIDTARGEEVYDFIIQNLAGPGCKPRIDRHLVNRDMLLQIVAGGPGLTLINEAAAAVSISGGCFKPIEGEELVYCAVRSQTNDNSAARRLFSLAKELSKNRRKH